ncbi:MAG: hypothetical protein K0R57_750 [Paenibacillaceae bacterium]|jgi:uncharacterized membrane protein|nr:hypothetical protein [Paenibacillaceae bacterium]
MLVSLLIIVWVVVIAIAASALFYSRHYNGRLLGVTLGHAYAEQPEVQAIAKGFSRACYTALLLLVGLSLFIPVQGLKPYVEFYMMVLVLADLFATWLIIHRYQTKLETVKKENGWIEPRTHVVTVDLNVSKEKGKSGISVVWSWLFVLISALPMAYLLASPKLQELYPLGFSLIGPLCQLSMVFLYYQMRSRHMPVLSNNTELNKACARTQERINTIGATLSGLAMLVFWLLFNISILYSASSLPAVLSSGVLVASLLGIAHWQQKNIRASETRFFGGLSESVTAAFEQEGVWKWGCYYNPGDSRIFVPKGVANMGWTINLGNPAGKAIGISALVLIFVVIGTVTGMFLYVGSKDYAVMEYGSQIKIDAAMYDITFEKDRVVNVSMTDTLPRGNRTNGFGGANKSFGHYTMSGYGKCRLYLYNDVDQYIVIRLEGDNPAHVILNAKSQEDTRSLFQTIEGWLGK